MIKIYVSVTGDLFHYGHISFFKKAREFGDSLMVGICSDEDVAAYKWPPVMNLNQRVAVIKYCNLVDQIVPGAPPETTAKFIKDNQIDLVVATKAYSKATLNRFYKDPQRMGILQLVDYKDGISTSCIVERCAELHKKRQELEKKL